MSSAPNGLTKGIAGVAVAAGVDVLLGSGGGAGVAGAGAGGSSELQAMATLIKLAMDRESALSDVRIEPLPGRGSTVARNVGTASRAPAGLPTPEIAC